METATTWIQAITCLALGFVMCWGITSLILKAAANREMAGRARDFHHGHKRPIPRLGGIGIISAFTGVTLAIFFSHPLATPVSGTLLVIVLTSLAMFALGFWDDLRPLGAKTKFLAQIAIAAAAYFGNIRIELFKLPVSGIEIPLGLLGFVATVFWLVSLSNLINLIDGIDGLAGGICLMLMFLMTNLGAQDDLGFSVLLPIGVAGALLAFLKFNYPPAKIYMGDGAAYFLGFLIGVLSIVNSNKGTVAAALIAPAFALALPIVDVSLAVLRRGLRGLPIFRPDQKHIHHRLITLGISHEQTLLNLYTVSLLCLFLAFGIFYLQGRLLPLYTGLLFLVLLIAGHLSGFTANWFTIGSQLGKSLHLRKQTRYALTLDRWFVLEAERANSLDDLWQDYRFVVQKLGFAKVSISLPAGTQHVWEIDGWVASSLSFWHTAHEISDGTVIDFIADKQLMSETEFGLLGDLASETWYKAVKRWHSTRQSRSVGLAPLASSRLATIDSPEVQQPHSTT